MPPGSIVVDTTRLLPSGSPGRRRAWAVFPSGPRRATATSPSHPRPSCGPRAAAPRDRSLRNTRNRADYLLLAPREFLPAARAPRPTCGGARASAPRPSPSRTSTTSSVSAKQVPAAVKAFLAYAYHAWASLRPATSSSSVTPPTIPRTSRRPGPRTASPPPSPGPASSGPPPTRATPRSTATTSSPISPSAVCPPPTSPRPR